MGRTCLLGREHAIANDRSRLFETAFSSPAIICILPGAAPSAVSADSCPYETRKEILFSKLSSLPLLPGGGGERDLLSTPSDIFLQTTTQELIFCHISLSQPSRLFFLSPLSSPLHLLSSQSKL
ncbi:hypothetical protein AVEN_109668-1 [Araneus ventricosus]|uniref:Uncharacterized protein n=1 Tax=Araneus ventricosus TaxID=182803 RepID=A0A4Y2FYJ6_ARAVE|nr:hypothetical protein AVEN_109668-1 [Araneus ventricosus]